MKQVMRCVLGMGAGVGVCALVGFLSAIPYMAAISFPYVPSMAEAGSALAFVGTVVAAVAAMAGLALFIAVGIPLHLILVRLGRAKVGSYAFGGFGTSLLFCVALIYAVHANWLSLGRSDLTLAVAVALLCGPLAEVSFWKVVRPDRHVPRLP